jgi:hypothetical protein|tara:strand:- start:17 stop:265 length:249 start_codon:yes stop_codon:yes gene_type:complete
MNKDKSIIANPKLNGQVGENAVWDGPLSKEGFPMGEGSSSGITPMEVSKYPTSYNPMPITRRAMVNAGGGDTADDFKVLSKK